MPISDDMHFSPSPDGRASPSDLFQAIVFDVLMRCNVAKPATVLAWAPPIPGKLPATVSVQIDFMYARAIDNMTDLQPGETLSIESAGLRAIGMFPPLPNVPVVQWGPPSFQWRGAIPVGTTGLVVFTDSVLDQWKSRGGPLDPALYERHSLNCGVFMPTLYHGANTPTINPAVDVLGPNDDSAGLEIATASDKSIRMFTTGATANVDAATAVQLGNPMGPLLGVARQTDKTSADTAMAVWIGQVQAVCTAAAALLGMSPPTPPTDFGYVSTSSAKVQAQ